MKISVLTPTYNREKLLKNLYNSLIENTNYGLEIEWLIMDDGSKDNTKQVVENFEKTEYKPKNLYSVLSFIIFNFPLTIILLILF